MRCGTFVIVLALAGLCAPVASAGSFTDPDARAFTLTTDRDVRSVVALGDGSAVYGSGKTVVRVTPEGAMTRVRVPEEVGSLAPERSGSVMMVGRWGRTVWRVNLRTRRTARVATIEPADGLSPGDGLTALATFADGPILVAGGVHYWQVTRAGTVRRLPDTRGLSAAYEMAALPGQRFAASFGTNLYIVTRAPGTFRSSRARSRTRSRPPVTARSSPPPSATAGGRSSAWRRTARSRR